MRLICTLSQHIQQITTVCFFPLEFVGAQSRSGSRDRLCVQWLVSEIALLSCFPTPIKKPIGLDCINSQFPSNTYPLRAVRRSARVAASSIASRDSVRLTAEVNPTAIALDGQLTVDDSTVVDRASVSVWQCTTEYSTNTGHLNLGFPNVPSLMTIPFGRIDSV
jgi:hypothetical protein